MQKNYKRELGLIESLSIVVGRIIGSGIFKTPAPIMLITGSIVTFFGTWILGGILTIFSAMLYAEMVSTFPKSGGPYEFLKRAYHPIVPFLRGWAMFFVSETSSIVIVGIVFSEYFLKTLLVFFDFEYSLIIEMLITILLIWSFTVFNSIGLKFAGWFQNILSLLKIFAIVYIIFISFSNINRNIDISSDLESFTLSSFLVGVGSSLRYAFFSYSGWEGATYVAEEVRNPTRNLPLSLFIGIGLVMLLYILTNLSYLTQMTKEEIALSKFVAFDAIQNAIGSYGAIVISVIIMISTSSNVNAQIFTKSRTWHAMARDGLFFSFLKDLNSNALPVKSLIFQALWATVLTIFSYFSMYIKTTVSIYERVIDFFSFTSAIFNVLTIIAVLILRKKYPNVQRPFKVKYFYSLFIVVLSVYAFYAFYTLYTAFFESMMGLILLLSGLLYWHLGIKKHKNP